MRLDTLFDTVGEPHDSRLAQQITHGCGCPKLDCHVSREQVVAALGPLRLKAMADDAPVDEFRRIEKLVLAIDDAFNQEALANREARKT